MEPDDRHIMEHLGRYRVSIRQILAMLKAVAHLSDASVSRLHRTGLIAINRGLPGNRSIYQLTKRGAALIGVSEARARPFRSQALLKHLGILLFCHVDGAHRYRLEDDELRMIVGEPLPEGAHCMAMFDGRVQVLNVYVPGQRTSIRSVTRRIREHLDEVRRLPKVRELLEAGNYGFAIVTQTTERRSAILRALRIPERNGGGPLAKQVSTRVEALPTFDLVLNGKSPSQKPKQPRPNESALMFEPADSMERMVTRRSPLLKKKDEASPMLPDPLDEIDLESESIE